LEHDFTSTIRRILSDHFGEEADNIYRSSDLLQYLNIKTRSATRGSKARGSFGNLYAIYVLLEDYVQHGFDATETYSDYEGAQFSELLQRQRELPFGAKLQNHALNHRLNQEFRGKFPQQHLTPIIRDTETSRYWFNELLLIVTIGNNAYNLSRVVIDIIDAYTNTKQGALKSFIDDLLNLRTISNDQPTQALEYIQGLLRPNVDARIFEIVSYAILKSHYYEQTIYWGWTLQSLAEERLTLYKTGRTNANDGGIDFVMKPLGRFFQVTETTDFRKYFLDIDKVIHYPITFVVKSEQSNYELMEAIESQAQQLYPVKAIADKYMSAIEEVINIPQLVQILYDLAATDRVLAVVDEIVTHSKIEFQYSI